MASCGRAASSSWCPVCFLDCLKKHQFSSCAFFEMACNIMFLASFVLAFFELISS